MDGGVPLIDREITRTALAARVAGTPARLGSARLVVVDGPAGSGERTFAARLADALGGRVAVLHMEDLCAGWILTGAIARLAAGILGPLAAGRTGGYHRHNWAAGRFAVDLTPVPVPDVLVVEDCGSSPRALAPWASLGVWIGPWASVRIARGVAATVRHWPGVAALAGHGGGRLHHRGHPRSGRSSSWTALRGSPPAPQDGGLRIGGRRRGAALPPAGGHRQVRHHGATHDRNARPAPWGGLPPTEGDV